MLVQKRRRMNQAAFQWDDLPEELKQEVIRHLSLRMLQRLMSADFKVARRAMVTNVIPSGEWFLGLRNRRVSLYNSLDGTWLRLHTYPRRYRNSLELFNIVGTTRSGLVCVRSSKECLLHAGCIHVCNPLFPSRRIVVPKHPSSDRKLLPLFLGIQDTNLPNQFRIVIIEIVLTKNREVQRVPEIEVKSWNQPLCWVYDSHVNSWKGMAIPLLENEFVSMDHADSTLSAVTFHGDNLYFVTHTPGGKYRFRAFHVLDCCLYTMLEVPDRVCPAFSASSAYTLAFPTRFVVDPFFQIIVCGGQLVMVEQHTEEEPNPEFVSLAKWTAIILLRVFNCKTRKWEQLSRKTVGMYKPYKEDFALVCSASDSVIALSQTMARNYLLYDMIKGTWSRVVGCRKISGTIFPAYLSTSSLFQYRCAGS